VFANTTEPDESTCAISPDSVTNEGSLPVCPIRICPSVPRPKVLKASVPEPTTIP